MLEARYSGGKRYCRRHSDSRRRERQFKIGPADRCPSPAPAAKASGAVEGRGKSLV